MGEEFYSIIKLVSGEEVFSLISVDSTNEENPIIIMQNPVIIKMINQGQYIKVKPWIELSEEDIHIITLDKIITMTETTDQKLIEIYNHYIKEDMIEIFPTDGHVRPDSKMGYISTVEDARKNLENLFKLKSKES